MVLVAGSAHPAGGTVGSPAKTILLTTDPATVGLTMARMDGDAYADLVIAEAGRVTTVYGGAALADVDLHTPPGGAVSTIVETSLNTLFADSLNVAVADVNGDHVQDIVIGRRSTGSVVEGGHRDRLLRTA